MRYSAFVLLAVVTSVCASDLPRSAYPVLLARLHANKVLGAEQFRRRTVGGFDYLGFQGSFAVSSRFESVYHPEVVLRKRHTESDWTKAAVLSCRGLLDPTFRLPDDQFVRALYPWPR